MFFWEGRHNLPVLIKAFFGSCLCFLPLEPVWLSVTPLQWSTQSRFPLAISCHGNWSKYHLVQFQPLLLRSCFCPCPPNADAHNDLVSCHRNQRHLTVCGCSISQEVEVPPPAATLPLSVHLSHSRTSVCTHSQTRWCSLASLLYWHFCAILFSRIYPSSIQQQSLLNHKDVNLSVHSALLLRPPTHQCI